MKDKLLTCLTEVTEALVAETRDHSYIYRYQDVNLGERYACSVCGTTSEFGPDQFAARHQPWCRIEKTKRILLKAHSYLGLNA